MLNAKTWNNLRERLFVPAEMKNGEGGKITLYRNLNVKPTQALQQHMQNCSAKSVFFFRVWGRGCCTVHVCCVYNNIKLPYGLLLYFFAFVRICFVSYKKKSIYLHLGKSFSRASDILLTMKLEMITINYSIYHTAVLASAIEKPISVKYYFQSCQSSKFISLSKSSMF